MFSKTGIITDGKYIKINFEVEKITVEYVALVVPSS